MWKFKASKYKNAAPKIPKKEEWISDISANGLPQSCGNHIKAGCVYMAFQVDTASGGNLAVLPLMDKGRKDQSLPLLHAHGDYITDFDFSPFDDYLLATGSQDSTVKVWRLPEGGFEGGAGDAVVTFPAEDRRIETVTWHPTASDVLSVSTTTMVKVYDVQTAQSKYNLDVHKDQVQSVSWRGDGSVLATSAKDKKLRVLDPRAGSVVQETEGFETVRDSRVLWLGDSGYILTTGFGSMRAREVRIRDVRNLGSTLTRQEMGTSTGVIMPFFDPDTNMVFLAGKADTMILFKEFTEKTPYLTDGSSDIVDQIKGVAMVPKRAMELMKAEVNRLLVLTKNAVIPLPYIVPRKTYVEYHPELFPDTAGSEPALSGQQWFDGENAQVTKVILDPHNKGTPVKKPVIAAPVSKPVSQQKAQTAVPASSGPTVKPVQQPVQRDTGAATPPKAAAQAVCVEPKEVKGQTGSAEPSGAEVQEVKQNRPKFTGVRQSKFRHLKGTVLHRKHHIENIRNLSKSIPGESDMFAANKDRCAVPLSGPGGLVAVFEFSKPGKQPDTGLPMVHNGSQVLDFVWDPFNNQRLAVACDDAKVRLWDIPAGGLTETLTQENSALIGHTEKIYFIRFHPLAQDILASASYDMTVRIWDVGSGEEKLQLEGHTDTIFCLSWSPDGKYCATVCKDGKLRVYNARNSSSPIIEGPGPDGSRGARVAWTCGGQYLLVSGFNKQSTRTLQLYDIADLSETIGHQELNTSPSILVPYYDEDSSTVFLTGRGDGTVYAYEVSEDPPHLFPLSNYSGDGLHQALSFLPKCEINVRDVEFAKGWRLTATTVEPVSFTVPRIKKEYFQDDLFPDTKKTWEPVLSAAEWLAGMNRVPRSVSLRPADMKLLSDAPVMAPKPKKYESFKEDTYKTDAQKKEELLSAMTNKLETHDEPLPQDLTEGVDPDEWDD